MAATTFRTDVRAILVTILGEQQTATPTLLRKVSATRPNLSELPAAWVSGLSEEVVTDQGTRTRTMTPEITIADNFREGGDTDFDTLIDLMVDRFTDAWSRLGGSAIIGSAISIRDAELEIVGTDVTTYRRAVILTLPGTIKREGRL